MNAQLKSDFLLNPEVIFLNHGSFGATPRPVFEAYQAWQRQLEFQPVEFFDRRAPHLLQDARSTLAEYVGTTRDNLVFVCNATTAGNIVARSLNLAHGDEVLASNHEYGALDRAWWFLSEQKGFAYINYKLPFPLTNHKAFVDAFWQGVTERTKAIFFSHITSPTGLILPVAEICAKARAAGILTIVDGAHAPGHILLDLDTLGADFYFGNLHKWLCAPKGSAFLYANPEKQHLLKPLVVSWGFHSDKPGHSQFQDLYQWTGTRDISAFLAVPAAIRFQEEKQWSTVRPGCHQLAKRAIEEIMALTGLPCIHDGTDAWFGQMAAALLPGECNLEDLKSRLYDHWKIEIPLIEWMDQKLIRASFQGYNSVNDLEVFIRALRVEL